MQTTALEAFLVAAASLLVVSPLAVGLLAGGYMAMRSKADVVYATGVGLLAVGVTLVVEVVVIALVFA